MSEEKQMITTEDVVDKIGVSYGASTSEDKIKDSTNELPMFGLDDSVDLIGKIHEEALERVAMPDVAKAFGYSHASSTPFYRKMVAARLFGLVASSGAELTTRAKDILKPISENAKGDAFLAAVNGIAYYAELIALNDGKRPNSIFIANSMSRKFNISIGCAKICAKAFLSSLKAAGMLSGDDIVVAHPDRSALVSDLGIKIPAEVRNDNLESDQVEYTLYMDKSKLRTMMVKGPISITFAEYRRLCDWLRVTWIIDPPDEGDRKNE